MPTDDDGSVTIWLGVLKAGDQAAAQPLWERYFQCLVHRARARLRSMGRRGAAADEEDAALSAFDSFCAGVARGRFPKLDDREDLWRLLVTIAARKCVDQARRDGRQKRGGGRVLDEAALDDPRGAGRSAGLDALIGPEPTPAFAALVAEEHRRLLDGLGDETLRRIALLKMEGCTLDEIATELGCARRTVVNKLQLIRMRWEHAS
jgi:DNA-directed RNA polymerase specialized sigma24 family protein